MSADPSSPAGLHVVLINWNTPVETLACMDHLWPLLGARDRVQLIDNGSRDDSVERFQRVEDARLVLHEEPSNTGFAHAANRGLRAARAAGAEHALLLNNDARLHTDAISALIEASRRKPEAGLYGPRIYADPGLERFWACGVKMGGGPNLCRLRGHGERDDGRSFRTEEAVDSLTGAVLLIRREVLERVGEMDEAYFVYVEDADYCARAIQAGFQPLYVPEAIAIHAGAGSTGGGYSSLRKYLTAHGSVLYLRKHGSVGLWAGFLVFDLLAWPLVALVAWRRGRLAGAQSKLRGLWDGLRGRAVDRALPDRTRDADRTPAK